MKAMIRFLLVMAVFFSGQAYLTNNAKASERSLAVPLRTIYPKEVLRESDFTQRSFLYEPAGPSLYVESIQPYEGFVARTTLPAFRPVAHTAVERARRIGVGAQLRVVFRNDGIEIATMGTAIQSGATGEIIQVRNTQSGSIVAGEIQPDGSIRVAPQ